MTHAVRTRRPPRLLLMGWAVVLLGAAIAAAAVLAPHHDDSLLPLVSPDLSASSTVGQASESSSPSAPAQSPEPTAAVTTDKPAASLGRSTPLRLRIPGIGVDSPLMQLGLLTDGSLQVPPSGFPAGWFAGAPTPGEIGPAIIAGHVDWNGRPAVFYELRKMSVGDEVDVMRSDGKLAEFRVTRVARFAKDAFPSELVYGNINHAGLRLITCGGSFNRQARSYTDNIIVFADLVGSHTA